MRLRPLFAALLALAFTSLYVPKSRAQSASVASPVVPTGYAVMHTHSDGSPSTVFIDPDQVDALFDDGATQAQIKTAIDDYAAGIAARVLRLPASAAFTMESMGQIGKLWQSAFTVSFDGVPLADRRVSIIVGAMTHKPMMLQSTAPTATPRSSEASLSTTEAATICQTYIEQNYSTTTKNEQTPKLMYIVGGESQLPVLGYESTFRDAAGAHLWRIRIDAASGDVLDIRDILESIGTANGTLTALVHPQNSYDSLVRLPMPYETIVVNGITTATDSNGNWSVSGVSSPYTVTSTFASTYNNVLRQDGTNGTLTLNATELPLNAEWTNANSDPAERDAYYHVNRARLYVRRLDPALTKLDAKLAINVNLNQTCNAYYDPSNVSVNFFKAGGSNCSNTGEIADVIEHEFGHRVADARYTQHGGANIVDGSLGEGFADLVSSFMRDDSRIGIGFFQKNTLLRNCANTKKWPADLNADIHISGEIISGAIWDLRKLIGHDTAERIFHMMEYLKPDGIGSTAPAPMLDAFTSVLSAVLATDDDDNNLTNGTPHTAQILKAFNLHNIGLSGLLSVSTQQIKDQDSLVASYPVSANVSYTGKIGTLDANSIVVNYSVDAGKHYVTAPLTLQSGSQYVGTIPRVSGGSVVQYYVSAATTYTDGGSGASPVQTFLVGFHRAWFDDAESDQHWSLSATGDQATTGLWTRDIPYGTYNVLPDYVQQDTDHTPNGSYCFLTGNANKATHSRAVGLDDVDNGAMTLTTPLLDASTLSNPMIRYWYYYRNDAGSNAGIPKWLTEISSDGGTSWKTIQNTSVVATGWTAFLFPVSSYVTPTANMLVRFVATDNVQAIVEAGIDDFELLSGPKSEIQAVSEANGAVSFDLQPIVPSVADAATSRAVSFSLGKSGHVVAYVKDILGNTVATPYDAYTPAGLYRFEYRNTNLASGTYWVQLLGPEGVKVTRFVVQR